MNSDVLRPGDLVTIDADRFSWIPLTYHMNPMPVGQCARITPEDVCLVVAVNPNAVVHRVEVELFVITPEGKAGWNFAHAFVKLC